MAVNQATAEQVFSASKIARRWRPALQVIGLSLWIAMTIVGYAWYRTGSGALVLPYLKGQTLLFEPKEIELRSIRQGATVEKYVRVLNLAEKETRLVGAQVSCGCLTTEELPVVIPPGSERQFAIRINMAKPGDFEHMIRVFSDDERASSSSFIRIRGTVE